MNDLVVKYDKLMIYTSDNQLEDLKLNFAINDVFFVSVIILLSIVYIITTNAALVGLYDRRTSEFELYHSLGIPKKHIQKKVISEILLMNGIGIIICFVLSITTIFLLNYFVFESSGLRMRYYAPLALVATVISDIVIIVICMILRLRMISKLKMAA